MYPFTVVSKEEVFVSLKMNFFILLSVFPSFISANLGGVLCRMPKDSGYQCGMSVPHSAYHFDVTVGQCIEFHFFGCGGNQNRFGTKEECIKGCGVLARCVKGLPLMDFAGNLKHCDGDRVPCPGGYECIGQGMDSVCCWKADRICGMSVDAGKHCGTVSETRFFYDSGANLCRPFAYLGCAGNENIFKTKGECLKFCAPEISCLKGDPWPDRYAVNRIASCHTDKDCPQNYTCTQRGKLKVCCPSAEFVCGSPFETKNSCRKPGETRQIWTFNYKKGQCSQVEISSCSEQLNVFASLEQCTDYCIGTCPEDGEIHINPYTNLPQMCNMKTKNGCPLGYECIKRSKFSSICCKTVPTCPAPESMLLAAMGIGEAVRCISEVENSCPEGYTCQKAPNNEYVCCTPPLSCPFGWKALRQEFNQPHICTIGIPGNCPAEGYFCVRADLGDAPIKKSLCCKPEKICVLPFISPKSKKSQKCFPGESSCPDGTHCLALTEFEKNVSLPVFYCCHDVDIFTCPDGEMPMIDKKTNKPEICNMSNPLACPDKFSCQKLLDGSSSCCPEKKPICRHPVMKSNGQMIPCMGEKDRRSCRGSCRLTADMKYHCCRN